MGEMRVMLVDPPDFFLEGKGITRQVLPMGLAMVAAACRPRHDVTMLLPDVRAYKGDDPWGEIARAIEGWKPDVIGITSVTATFPGARRIAALAGQMGIPAVLGGVHATFVPEKAARLPGVTAVVAGEGEETFPALLEALERRAPLEAIPGVFTANGRGPERVPIADLDALPLPDRDSVLWPDDLHPGFYQALITLRGCPYRCIYCSVPSGPEGRTRYRSPAKVAEEAAHVVSRYRASYLFFHDSVFTLHRKRTLAICDELERRGLRVPFACQTRADRVDEALLDRLVEVGLHQVFFGIESGDRQSLKLIKKDMPLEQIRRAVGWVKARGVRCTGFFMVGFPWETEELIRGTADFACELGLDAVSLFSATPLPGTELWEMALGTELPESVDFRTPQVNLTGLAAPEYARIFNEVKARIDAYNQSTMMRAFHAWPGAGLPDQP
jgi:anaerobic magnesium-protoporphyrin IX monomethyl ester cyclase